MSNPNPNPPPISGRWKPGQSGNPHGVSKKQRYQKLIDEALARASKNRDPDESIVDIFVSQIAVAKAGDQAATRDFCDRYFGKPPQQIGQDPDSGPLLVRWLNPGEEE